jgi:protein-tyrosine phosphatase
MVHYRSTFSWKVHCANGSNRSASVVIALLMLPPHSMPLADAYAATKAARRETNPLTDNRRELLQFEATLRGGKATLTEKEWMQMK